MTGVVISFAKSAIRDLEVLQAGHSGQGSHDVGIKVVTEVLECIEALAEQPGKGRVVPEFGQPFLRELTHPLFRIVYHFDPEHVRVVRLWHSMAS
jgi:plasmid stabilization system protein ParE